MHVSMAEIIDNSDCAIYTMYSMFLHIYNTEHEFHVHATLQSVF